MPLRTITSLIYVSTAEPGLDHDDLLAIEDVARRINEQAGITGLLLFNGFNFLQCVEGERAVVQDCMLRIDRDDRHSGITIVSRREVAKRQFANWHIAYRTGRFQNNLTNEEMANLLAQDTVFEATRTLFESFLSFGIKTPEA